MICPKCGAENENGSKFCEYCGNKLPQMERRPAVSAQEASASGSAALVMGRAARQARLSADYSGARILSTRTYNLVLIGVVLWGLLINVILCFTAADAAVRMDPAVLFLGYIVLAFLGTVISAKSRSAVTSFLGYNLVVVPLGLVLAAAVEIYGGAGSAVVRDAFVYTALITVGMLCAILAFPELFKGLGGALAGCLLGLILCEAVLLILRVPQNMTDWVAAGIFSLYIGYDVYRSQQFERTLDNAVDCALDIYLDIANLFIRLLSIMRSKDDD